jgi:hypothetical protein
MRHRREAEYDSFLAAKVEDARGSIERGEGIDHSDVEAEFARRRKAVRDQSAGAQSC